MKKLIKKNNQRKQTENQRKLWEKLVTKNRDKVVPECSLKKGLKNQIEKIARENREKNQ